MGPVLDELRNWFGHQLLLVADFIPTDSETYSAFKEIGWKWAGELMGQKKDFMHFSRTGD